VYACAFVFVFGPIILLPLINAFPGKGYSIPSGAMIPAIQTGDHIYMNTLRREPERGRIAVFTSPHDGEMEILMRVIAGAGDVVEIRAKHLYVNETLVQEPYVQFTRTTNPSQRDNFGPLQVPPGKFFALGDNRDQSYDSRYWGFADAARIRAQSGVIYWSRSSETGVRWSRMGRHVD
jgi:signal peptidase I